MNMHKVENKIFKSKVKAIKYRKEKFDKILNELKNYIKTGKKYNLNRLTTITTTSSSYIAIDHGHVCQVVFDMPLEEVEVDCDECKNY